MGVKKNEAVARAVQLEVPLLIGPGIIPINVRYPSRTDFWIILIPELGAHTGKMAGFAEAGRF